MYYIAWEVSYCCREERSAWTWETMSRITVKRGGQWRLCWVTASRETKIAFEAMLFCSMHPKCHRIDGASLCARDSIVSNTLIVSTLQILDINFRPTCAHFSSCVFIFRWVCVLEQRDWYSPKFSKINRQAMFSQYPREAKWKGLQ